jgi:hypothetical protein
MAHKTLRSKPDNFYLRIDKMARSSAVTFEHMQQKSIMLTGAIIKYEPSVFMGDGSETRKNIMFQIRDEGETSEIIALEATLLNTTKMLSSAFKDGALKAKITPSTVKVYNDKKERIEPPGSWKEATVNVILVVKGAWASRTLTGLAIEVTDIQVLSDVSLPCPF